MEEMTRRDFVLNATLAAGASAAVLSATKNAKATPYMVNDDISIAQWALVDEIREGKWTTLDFPRIAREEFDINGVSFEDGLKWAADSYSELIEYSAPAGINVVIENHGSLSNDPDFLVALAKKINNRYFGLYPDMKGEDPYTFVKKTIPYATGVSYRNQPTEEETARLIRLCHDSGYRGFYGIESGGRDGIRLGKRMLNKYLFEKE